MVYSLKAQGWVTVTFCDKLWWKCHWFQQCGVPKFNTPIFHAILWDLFQTSKTGTGALQKQSSETFFNRWVSTGWVYHRDCHTLRQMSIIEGQKQSSETFFGRSKTILWDLFSLRPFLDLFFAHVIVHVWRGDRRRGWTGTRGRNRNGPRRVGTPRCSSSYPRAEHGRCYR